MECGVSLVEEVEDTFEDDNGFDLGDRILCPDGTCTGIIVDGRCTECGRTPDEVEKQEAQQEAQQEELQEEQQVEKQEEKEKNREEI
jgi:hypothetical protein